MSKEETEALPATKVITLLEREKLNQGIDPNGTFSINLDEQIVLKEGESIELTKAFVDTTLSESSFITVEPDETEITIKHGIYMTDLEPNEGDPVAKPSFGLWSENIGYRPDAKKYILNNESTAFLSTFFDWQQSNNTFAPPLTAAFKAEIQGLVPEDNKGFEYVMAALLPPTATPAYPASPGLVLDTQYMIGGHCILTQHPIDSSFQFYYYPNGYVPAGDYPTENAHTAIIDRWIEGGVTKGWRIKANPNTTETIENRKWLFASDADGYNYFDDGGNAHMVQLNSIKLPINFEWTAPYKNGQPDFSQACYPGLVISYYDPRTQRQNELTKIFNASAYDPVTKDGVQVGGGMTTLEAVLPRSGAISRIDRPSYFQDAKYGWGPNSGWDFYKFEQFVDPYNKTGTVMFPKIVISIDDLPRIQFYYFNKEGSPGLGTGFINTKSQYYNAAEKHSQTVPWQCSDTTPVINPASTGSTLTPREYTSKFTINSGQYTYEDFAALLTDKINALSSPVVGLSNNPYGVAAQEGQQPVNLAGYSSSYFFQTTYEFKQQYDGYSSRNFYPNDSVYAKIVTPARTLSDGTVLPEIPAKTSEDHGDQPFWVSEDGKFLFQFDKTEVDQKGHARGCGASQFSFIFDEAEQAFAIAIAHTPIYANGPTVGTIVQDGPQIIKQVDVGRPDPATYLGIFKSADTSSGIFLTSLEPRSLFFDKMRLNRSLLTDIGQTNPNIQDFTGADSSFTDGALQSVMTHEVSLRTGDNITGLFNSVDGLVRKQSSYGVIPQWGEDIATDTLVSITGQNQVQSTEDDPFYQIEISGINNQDIIGQPVKNNLVQAMVGKYYSNGNFTQGEEDGLVYVHKGEPIVIKSLRVRILDSLGNVEPDLGPASAIILNVNQEK